MKKEMPAGCHECEWKQWDEAEELFPYSSKGWHCSLPGMVMVGEIITEQVTLTKTFHPKCPNKGKYELRIMQEKLKQL